MIKKETIDQIREQSDIVQVISEFLPLKKTGKYYRTLCPFHSEKTPSFNVSPERQIYHCFGCGAGGSVFTFLMQYEKLSFPDAIRKLASKLGITIETEKSQYQYQPLLDACEYATNFFQTALQHSQSAMEYLKKRTISLETINRFRLGYAPSGNLLLGNGKKHGFFEEILIKAGLIIKKEDGCHDWFYERIIFPIFSISGKVIAFGARTLDDTREPKYLNSPETSIFRKGENLYGLFQAKNYLYQNIPILVEGNFDLLSLVDKGINNVIAPLGTAFTREQALILRRFSNQIIIAFDGDSAGRAATLRILELLLKINLDPQILFLPDGFDPDKYIKTFGKDSLNQLIKQSLDFIDFLLKLKETSTVANKQICLREITNYISLIDSNISQELYLNKTSEIFKVSKEILLHQIQKESKNVPKTEIAVKSLKQISLKLIEQQVLPCILTLPEYAIIAKQEVPPICFSSPEIQTIIQTVYINVELDNFSLAKIIDEIEKPELKQLIADLSFRSKSIPTKNEFQSKLRAIKASWFYKEMLIAKEKGDLTLLEKFSLEHYNLKKKLSRTRSKK